MAVPYLQVDNLTKSFGDLVLFENISFGIAEGQRVGLIAKNGTGKTTLLNVIAGKEGYDNGNIVFRRDLRVDYLEQDPQYPEELTVLEACFHHGNSTVELIKEYERCMETDGHPGLDELLVRMDQEEAWEYEQKAKQILSQLKIRNFDQKVKQLSGGQLKRVALANALITEPDLLILDEPTNHLDLDMTEWLEEYLRRTNLSLLMVTHDRYFLDRVCSEIIEIDNRQLYQYKGNYSYYLEKRQERIDAKSVEIERANNLYRTELDWMRRMPQARGHKAKYRIDNFYKIKEVASQNTTEQQLELDIKGQRLGKKILELEHVNKSYGDFRVLRDFSYKFIRGEKIGIIGKNGVGKSTFLNIITRQIEPDSGTIEIGETVVYGYYKQDGISFKEDDRPIDIVKNISEKIDLGNGRVMSASQFLEYFLFPDKLQYSLVAKLSGGERRRLYLLTVLMSNPNFLILDEPTNDLDIMTLNVLEDYLKSFQGCLIIVSHDRFFTDKVVDRVFAFEGDGIVKDFPGNYTVYKNKKEEEELLRKQEEKKIPVAPKPVREKEKVRKLTFKERLEMQQLESDMEKLNTEKTELETALNSGTLDTDELVRSSQRIAEIIDLLDEKEMRWLELSEIE